MTLYSDRIKRIGTENAFKVGPHIARVESEGHEVIKLNLGEPDFNLPSFVKDEIKRQLDRDNTHYCDPQGLISLRSAIAEQMGAMRQIKISPEQVVVFPGGKPAIGLCQEAYCNPGDQIIYPSPGFPIYESFANYVGITPVPLHLNEEDGFTFSAEQLAELVSEWTKLIVLNFPSNPTGGVISKQELEAIADVILTRCSPDVRIFSDEIYEYITFDGNQHVSIASIPGMQQRTIINSGLSKTVGWTGGRVGYAVFPTAAEAEIFKNLNINYFSCLPPYNQEGAREVFTNPDTGSWVKEMVATFQTRRDVILDRLNQIEGISCQKPGGAFYLFPNISGICEKLGVIDAYEDLPAHIKEQTSPAGLFSMFALYHHHVAVIDRRSFGVIGSEGKHYIRLSIASDLSALENGVERLESASVDRTGFEEFYDKQAHLVL